MKQSRTVHNLFSTEALKPAPAEQPFWYTSGKFGPYYINTHFLFGDEASAKAMLADITREVESPATLAEKIGSAMVTHERENAIFRAVIDDLAKLADTLSFDLISGGERRDFFFSYPLAARLNVNHLTILKNGEMWLGKTGEPSRPVTSGELEGKTVLHVADLVTEASSYARAWLPAIAEAGAEIHDTLSVVDRNQGGKDVLAEHGVTLHSVVTIDDAFFRWAEDEGLINAGQAEQIRRFTDDPDQYIRRFLSDHPGFLADEAAKDERTRERVERCRALGFGDV